MWNSHCLKCTWHLNYIFVEIISHQLFHNDFGNEPTEPHSSCRVVATKGPLSFGTGLQQDQLKVYPTVNAIVIRAILLMHIKYLAFMMTLVLTLKPFLQREEIISFL